jgi:KDO2-lipid IV(A) lauroyltransferase
MTQALADVFAAGIAEHPEDWHMLQRLWLSDLETSAPREVIEPRGTSETSAPREPRTRETS